MIILEARENRRKDKRDVSQVTQQRSLVRVLPESLNNTIYLKFLLQQKSKCPVSVTQHSAQTLCTVQLPGKTVSLANGSFVPATEPQRTEQIFGSMYKKYIKKSAAVI